VRNLRYANILAILLLLGCSNGSSQNPAPASPGTVAGVPVGSGGGTGIFVAGCNFNDLDQNYAYDIVVSGSDNIGQSQKLGATIYNRSGSIQGQFTVEVVPGSTGSRLLETIQSINDGGASFKLAISDTASTGTYAANLIHASLANGGQINSKGLLCKAGH
jgi:hypothetical protein